MKKTGSIVILYGLIVFVGGLIGYIQAASIPSLVSGIAFGSLVILSGYGMIKKFKWGQWSALIVAFMLDAFFTFRFAKTLKFIPSGLMSLLSLAMVIIISLRINMSHKRK